MCHGPEKKLFFCWLGHDATLHMMSLSFDVPHEMQMHIYIYIYVYIYCQPVLVNHKSPLVCAVAAYILISLLHKAGYSR